MSEIQQRAHFDRRPPGVPANWPSRQQTEARLMIQTQTLNRYLEQLTHLHPEHYRNLGYRRPAYLSPELVAEIEKLHAANQAVELLDQVSGYFDRQNAVAQIGCGEGTFPKLLKEHSPTGDDDMRILRNSNNQNYPAYSIGYIARLKEVYDANHRPDHSQRPRQKVGSFIRGEVVNRSADLLAVEPVQHSEINEPQLVQLEMAERQAALTKVTTLIQQLDAIHHKYQRDEKYSHLKRQLYMASTELASTRPIPQGLERLLEQAKQYLIK